MLAYLYHTGFGPAGFARPNCARFDLQMCARCRIMFFFAPHGALPRITLPFRAIEAEE